MDNEPQTPMSQVLINGPTQNMNPNNASDLKGSFTRRGWGGMARFQARVWGLAKLSNFPGFCHLENGSFKLGSLYDLYNQKDANKPSFPGLKFFTIHLCLWISSELWMRKHPLKVQGNSILLSKRKIELHFLIDYPNASMLQTGYD